MFSFVNMHGISMNQLMMKLPALPARFRHIRDLMNIVERAIDLSRSEFPDADELRLLHYVCNDNEGVLKRSQPAKRSAPSWGKTKGQDKGY